MLSASERKLLTAYKKLHDAQATPLKVALMNIPLVLIGPSAAMAIPVIFFWSRLATRVTTPFWLLLSMAWLGMALGLALMSKVQGRVWPTVDRIIDWERVDDLLKAQEDEGAES